MGSRSVRAALVAGSVVLAIGTGGGGGAVAADRSVERHGDIGFSVASGTFTGELSVTLDTSVAGAEIRYTTDGELPGPGSRRYPGTPLKISATTQLRAQPFRSGQAVGDPGTALYLARGETVEHDLPVLVLDAYGAGKLGKDDYVDTAVLLYQPSAPGRTTGLNGVPTLATRAGIHLRGQSSSTAPKPGYRLELWDETDDDLDFPLLGMPADSDWVLRGPYLDKSLIRDSLAYSLGQDLGLAAPRSSPCEVYLNLDGGSVGPADYMGVYLLGETVKVTPDRLDLARLRKTDLTSPAVEGGYVMKFDHAVAEEPMLDCVGSSRTCWHYLEVVEPDPLQPEQQEWLTRYVQQVHDVLHASDFADPRTGYPAWLDVPSFVDYVIINELSRNLDAYARSAYLYKDRGGRLTAGPLWDYDLAWGNGGLRRNLEISGWQYQQQRTMNPPSNDWFVRLFADPAFVDQLADRWQELRAGALSDAALDARINELVAPLTAAADRNFDRWPVLTQNRVNNWVTTSQADTWPGQVAQLREWTHQRATWLDSQWG